MKRRMMILAAAVLAAACSKQEAKQTAQTTTQKVAEKIQDVFDVSTPIGKPDPADIAQQRERARFDAKWRELQSFRAVKIAQLPLQTAPEAPKVAFVTGKKETFKGLGVEAINSAPVNVPISGDMKGPSVLRTQVLLDRAHFSVGVIDGRWGRNSAIAVWWWQVSHGIAPTGDVDQATFLSLAQAAGNAPPVVRYTLTPDDVEGPFVSIPEDVYEQESLKCMCYESLREKLAERFHSAEDFLEQLNPDVDFSQLGAGATINVPNVRPPVASDQHDIEKIVVSIAGNSLNGYDAAGSLVFHAPTTVGAGYDPSPDETLKVVRIVDKPNFHYNPKLYHEVSDEAPDAHLKPGPNSPVGVVWIALSKAHYGIHGTKDPDAIGYASSHGCVRLTNWDAAELQHRIGEGIEVAFADTSSKGMPEVAR